MNLAETIKRMGKPLEEQSAFAKAGRDLQDYARKSGGVDKADFEKAATFMYKLAKANIADKGTHMSSFSKFFKDLDTDVRDRIVMILKKNSIMEEVIVEAPEDDILEDGHTDVASAKRQCKTIIDDAQAIMTALNSMPNESSLPTWWTNKLAVASTDLNKMNDYISNPTEMKEEVDKDKLASAIKKKLSDEGGAAGFAPLKDVAKKMGVDLTPEMLKGMDGIEQHRDGDYILDDDDDDDDMEEAKRDPSKSGGSGYDLYHKDFSSAMKHAYDYAKDKLGVEVDPKEIDDKVASGPRRPSKGKTNSYRLKGKDGKKAVQIQVANLDDKKFELNMYKESVELDEAKSKEQQIADLEKMLSRISGNTSSVKMKKFALQKKIDKLKNEEVEVELDEAKRTLEFEGNASNKNMQALAKKHGIKLRQKGKMVVATGDREAIDTMEIELDLVESADINEAKYQVTIKGAGRETVTARTEKEAIDKATRKMGVRTHGKKNEIEVKLMEDVDLNEAFDAEFKTDRYGNTDSFLDAIMNVVSEKKELDPVNKKALKKDFDDRKDKDINNDGDVDDSDEYLHKRRKAVSKAMKSEDEAEKSEREQEKEISDKEDEPKKKKVGKSEKQTKVDVNPSIEEEKGEEMTSAEMEKKDEIMKSLEKRKDEFVKKYGDRAKEVMARTAIKMAKKHA